MPYMLCRVVIGGQAAYNGGTARASSAEEARMPIFMDRHDVWETTAADVADAADIKTTTIGLAGNCRTY